MITSQARRVTFKDVSARRQHYLPAGLIGQFSTATTHPVRKRPIWIARRDVRRAYVQSAENVAWRNDFYTVQESPYVGDDHGENPTAVDDWWSHAERLLGHTIDAAATATTTKMIAGRSFASFVELLAQILARTPDFDRRFSSRFKGMGDAEAMATWRDNINAVRAIEIQRMRPALLYGRWYFLQFPSGSLVQNDRGYAGTKDATSGVYGVCFPLRHDLAVTVLSGEDSPELVEIDGAVYVRVGADTHGTAGAASLSEIIAAWADEEIYGPCETVVRAASPGLEGERQDAGPEILFGHSSAWLRDHELDYFNFVSALERQP